MKNRREEDPYSPFMQRESMEIVQREKIKLYDSGGKTIVRDNRVGFVKEKKHVGEPS